MDQASALINIASNMVEQNQGQIFNLLPINWSAIAAIATLCAVAVAFWSQWNFRKKAKNDERRELIERIIIPLVKSLDEAESRLNREARHIRNEKFEWRRIKADMPHLVSRLDDKMYGKIENFSKVWEELHKLTSIIQPDLCKTVKNILYPIAITPSLLKNQNAPGEDQVIDAHLGCELDGQYFTVGLYTLIVRQKSWSEFLNEMADKNGLLNKRRINEKISMPILYDLAEFEKIKPIDLILEDIRKKINNHPMADEFRKYFILYNNLLLQLNDLKIALEDFTKI